MRFFAGLIFALLVAPVGAHTELSYETVTSYQFNACLKHAEEMNGGRENIYISWASGMSHTCLFSKRLAHEAQAFVVDQCEKTIPSIKRIYGISPPCFLVVSQGQILDKDYRQALSRSVPFPVKIQIFDDATGAFNIVEGTYTDYPKAFEGLLPVEMSFVLHANGVLFCDGVVRSAVLSTKVDFQADCFDKEFGGEAHLEKIFTFHGRYIATPSKLRITSNRSWIEIEF